MKIAITRLAGKEARDASRCKRYGHLCYSVHPLNSEIRDDAVADFISAVERNEFDCLFFTSALPASLLAPRLRNLPRVIAIGPQTAAILKEYGVQCETLEHYYSREFVPYLGDWIMGKRVGIPRADVPNPSLLEAIRTAGGAVREFRCYGLEPTNEPLDLEDADALLFTSAMSFEKAIWSQKPDLLIMAIGDITADAMRRRGVSPVIVGDGSLEGTLETLNLFLKRESTEGKGPIQ